MNGPSPVGGHDQVLRWSHVLAVQVGRLRASRQQALAASRAVLARGSHTAADSQPFHAMAGDAHFALTAPVQLFRALGRFDGNLRLPGGLDERQVRTLRNALEHWDDDEGRAQQEMAALGADPASNAWRTDGSGWIGDLVEDELLRLWAESVYDELRDHDPASAPHALGSAAPVT